MRQDINLDILMGLPGSGKTTLAKQLLEKYAKEKPVAIHMDELRGVYLYGKKETTENIIKDAIRRNVKRDTKRIIFDGLVLTNEEVFKVITTIAQYFDETKVTIYYFKEDRETCLKNDGGRREIPSAVTILNAEYETVKTEELNERLKEYDAEILNVIKKDVMLKEGWERCFRHVAIVDNDNKLRSDKWCTGGAHGNCWDSSMSPVSPDKPLNFDNLDRMLEEIAPNITFLHYKRIQQECVDTEETYDHDYYGGGCTYLNWVCDLEKLYEILRNYNYIE